MFRKAFNNFSIAISRSRDSRLVLPVGNQRLLNGLSTPLVLEIRFSHPSILLAMTHSRIAFRIQRSTSSHFPLPKSTSCVRQIHSKESCRQNLKRSSTLVPALRQRRCLSIARFCLIWLLIKTFNLAGSNGFVM